MQEQPRSIEKWTKRKRVAVIIAILIVLVVTPEFVRLFMEAHDANKAFALFSDALITRDYDRAYNLTSPEFQLTTSRPAFISQQAILCSKLGGLRKVVRGSFETEEHKNGWSSNITAHFVFEHADRQFDFVMEKQGAVWKVYGYREQ